MRIPVSARPEENVLLMPLQVAPLTFSKYPHVNSVGGSYAHPLKGDCVSYWRNQKLAPAFKADETAVKQVVYAGRQQKTILSVKSLFIRTIAPWFAVTGAQVFGIDHACDAASLFDYRHALAKYTLTTAGLDNCLSFRFRQRGIVLDRNSEMIFPIRHISHWRALGRVRVNRTLGHAESVSRFVSNKVSNGFEKLDRYLREIDRLAPSSVREQRRILLWESRT